MIVDLPSGRTPSESQKPPPRRWLRFRLRTFLIAVVVFGMILGWIGRGWEQRRELALWVQQRSVRWSYSDTGHSEPGAVNFEYLAVGDPDGLPGIVFLTIHAPGYSPLKYRVQKGREEQRLALQYVVGKGVVTTITPGNVVGSRLFEFVVNAPSGNPVEFDDLPPDPIFFNGASPTHQQLLDYWKNTIEPLLKKYPKREKRFDDEDLPAKRLR